jgi:putative transposase
MAYEYKQFYRRKLPHLHSPGSTLFVTFRLAGTVPKKVIAEWQQMKVWLEHEVERVGKLAKTEPEEINRKQRERLMEFHRQWFRKFEDILHREETGPVWLKNPQAADAVAESLHFRNGKSYDLKAFCIMSNHVHVVFTPFVTEETLTEIANSAAVRYESSEKTLGPIMQSLKGFSARQVNKLLDRTGQFWDEESYDHQVRNEEELGRIVRYVLNNPVKARLVKDWHDWKWAWLKP